MCTQAGFHNCAHSLCPYVAGRPQPLSPMCPNLLCDVPYHLTGVSVDFLHIGYLDAGLKLLNSLTAPSIGGDVRISRGVASLMPGGPSAPGGSGGSGGSGQLGTEIGEVSCCLLSSLHCPAWILRACMLQADQL